MKHLFVALVLATFSMSSFAKVFDCWANFDGKPDMNVPALKFSLDSSEKIENGAVFVGKETASGRIMTARFAISAYSDVATMSLVIGESDKFETDFSLTSSQVEQTVGKESYLNSVGYVKGGFGYDYVAKMGCTLVSE